MVQTVAWFSGLETGDSSELNLLGASSSIQSTTIRSGAYSLKQAAAGTVLTTALSATQSVIRFYLNVPTLPGATTVICREVATDGVTIRLALQFNSSNKLQVLDTSASLGLTTTTGTATFSAGQWYRIEIAVDLAASGVVKVWVDGVLDINTTHTNDVSATKTGGYRVLGVASPNEYFFDDIRIDVGGVAAIGAGTCIARQGTAGTPTYDAWTKSGAGTAALCWSDTPVGTGTACTSSTSGAAQTMNVAKFSTIQSGHGVEYVWSADTINACKVATVAKAAAGSTAKIRRRVGGVDTDTNMVLTTSDKYFDDGIWTTTIANLETLEAGVVHAADANLETVEDVWVIVDFTSVDVPMGQISM